MSGDEASWPRTASGLSPRRLQGRIAKTHRRAEQQSRAGNRYLGLVGNVLRPKCRSGCHSHPPTISNHDSLAFRRQPAVVNGTDSHRHVGTNICEPMSSRNREPVACKASSSDETNLDEQIGGLWVDADVRRLLIGQNSSRLQAVCLHQRRRVRRTGIESIRQHPSGDYARRKFIPPQVRTLEICLGHIKQHIRIRRSKLGQRLLPLFDRFQNFAARHDELPFTMCRPVGGDSEPTQSCRQAVVGQTMLEGHAHTRFNTNVPLLAPPKPLTPEMRRNVNGSAVNRVPFSNWIVNLLPEINPLISRPD